MRRLLALGVIVTGSVGGCTTGSSIPAVGGYWMVKVNDNFANIYKYPLGAKPAPATSSVYLGTSAGDAKRYTVQAANRLQVSPGHVNNLS